MQLTALSFLIANKGYLEAIKTDPALAKGVNVLHGHVTYKSVAEALGLDYVSVE